jgi:surface antigen
MAFFNGRILKEDGNICCEGVMVALEQAERGEPAEWYGTVSAAVGIEMVAGQKYRLVLADGRSGEFMVRRNTSAGPQDRAISIQGLGPLE